MPADESVRVQERVRFISRLEPFQGLSREELERVAEAVAGTHPPGGGSRPRGERRARPRGLHVVRDGTLELVHKDVVVAIIAHGDVFGHPTLLTGLAPEFTTRARSESHLYCIPKDMALEILSRPEGVRFVARTCANA